MEQEPEILKPTPEQEQQIDKLLGAKEGQEQEQGLVLASPPLLSYDLAQAKTPDEIIADATVAAKVLKHVMLSKKTKVIVNDEIYPELEDWELCGRFFGCTAKIIETKYTTEYGAVGFEATATINRIVDGKEIGRAEAMCLMDESRWAGKPLFQVRSMAQTRAAAKAFRLVFSWILVLAGYKPTPAEEIKDTDLDTTIKPSFKYKVVE